MDRAAASERNSGRLVIVDGTGAASHRWEDGLVEFRPEIVASLREAGDLCANDVVIVDLPELGEQALTSIPAVLHGTPALRLLTPPYELTIFPDGRTIVKGTSDTGIARSLYARYIG